MKTLHLYLTRQILASLVMTVLVFTFVLLIGNVLKDILPLVMSGQVTLSSVATAIGLLIPFAWVYSLPMGMLTATLLVFGRFSADQELTAARASGISLVALVTPIFALSLLLCGVCALVNMDLGPRCRVAFNDLRFKFTAQLSASLLPEGRFTERPGFIFYIGKNRQGKLEDVMILMLENQTNLLRTVMAPRGEMTVDSIKRRLELTLYDAKSIEANGTTILSQEFQAPPQDLDSAQKAAFKPRIDDMTFRQLWAELRALEQRVRLPVSLKNLSPQQLKERKKQWEEQHRDLITPIVFQIHRQVAFSFACFGFTLIGIPLGIRVHRRETNVGIAIALVLVALYYSFILIGQSLQHRPEFLPYFVVWIPNFVFQAIGAVLLWRANRGI